MTATRTSSDVWVPTVVMWLWDTTEMFVSIIIIIIIIIL